MFWPHGTPPDSTERLRLAYRAAMRRPAFYPRIVKHGPLWKASQDGYHALGTTPKQAYDNLMMYRRNGGWS